MRGNTLMTANLDDCKMLTRTTAVLLHGSTVTANTSQPGVSGETLCSLAQQPCQNGRKRKSTKKVGLTIQTQAGF